MTVDDKAPGHPEILRIVAPNPGPMTLEGTNTYLYGSEPCVVIDPGPDDRRPPSRRSCAAAAERGGIGLVLLTHSHGDHTDGAEALASAVGSRRSPCRVLPADGEDATAACGRVATPGHAADHVCFLTERRGLLQRRPGARAGLDLRAARRRLARRLHGLAAPAPGRADRSDLPRPRPLDHGPGREARRVHRAPRDARAPPARRPRPRRALPGGAARRGLEDVPEQLLPAAAMAMEAHLRSSRPKAACPPT